MELTEWLLANFSKDSFYCMACKAGFESKGVIMLGLRKANDDPNGEDKLYLEYHCPKCGERQGFEMVEIDLLGFASRIIEDASNMRSTYMIHDSQEDDDFGKQVEPQYNTDESKKAKKRKNRSGISLSEKKKAIRMLEEADSWDDWLNQIGAKSDRK